MRRAYIVNRRRVLCLIRRLAHLSHRVLLHYFVLINLTAFCVFCSQNYILQYIFQQVLKLKGACLKTINYFLATQYDTILCMAQFSPQPGNGHLLQRAERVVVTRLNL
jgi:hypothetical protein